MYKIIYTYSITDFGIKIYGKLSENKPSFLIATIDEFRRIHGRGNIENFEEAFDFCFYVATHNVTKENGESFYFRPINIYKEIDIYFRSVNLYELGYVVKHLTIPLL